LAASSNKTKTAWKLVKENTCNYDLDDIITKINTDNKLLENLKK
jgi:hypothetical protein